MSIIIPPSIQAPAVSLSGINTAAGPTIAGVPRFAD